MSAATLDRTEELARTRPEIPLPRLAAVEMRKSVDTRAGRALLALLALLTVGSAVLLLTVGEPGDRVFAGFVSLAAFPVGLILPVLGILAVTSEWSQRTALTTFALEPRRARVVAAKLAALTALTVGVVAVTVASSVAATGVAHLTGGSAGFEWFLPAVGRVLLYDLALVLAGAGFGLALLNAPAAIVGFFVAPSLITSLAAQISQLEWAARWLNLTGTSAAIFAEDVPGRAWAQLAVSFAVCGLLPLALGTLRVLRREVQ